MMTDFKKGLIDHGGKVVICDRKYMDAYISKLMAVTSVHLPYAGGPNYKKRSISTVSANSTIESTGINDTTVVAASDDDDGDGDGDPDSDRKCHTQKKISCAKTPQTTLSRKSITISNRILRMAELKVRIGLSRSTIYEAINQGNFPASISLGARAVGWLESDVDKWLESRINASKVVQR